MKFPWSKDDAQSERNTTEVAVCVGTFVTSADFAKVLPVEYVKQILLTPSPNLPARTNAETVMVRTAAGAEPGRARYLDEVGRIVHSNTPAAVDVEVVAIDSIVGDQRVGHLFLDCVGSLIPAMQGARRAIETATAVHVFGQASHGDDPHKVIALLPDRTVTIMFGDKLRLVDGRLRTITDSFGWTANWPAEEGDDLVPLNDDELASLAVAAAYSADPTSRAHIGERLALVPELLDRSDIANALDDLVIDPNRAVVRSVSWWQARAVTDLDRSRRRLAAFERVTDRLTGPREQRPSPFPHRS